VEVGGLDYPAPVESAVRPWLTLHITDDIVRGISKAESSNIALLVLTIFLYGTLVLAERRSGHVIMLLVGLFAAGMPVIHMRGAHYGEIAKSTVADDDRQ
jgi:hypothetical protein